MERLAPHRYVFRSSWHIPALSDRTFQALADLERYPHWWPEFKRARLVSPGRGEFALRSVLPLTLRFSLEREIEDADEGHLRARAVGDIEGTVEWTVHEARGAARAEFLQDVLLRHPLAVRVDQVLRPVLEWNHSKAMKSGAAGLRRYLVE